MNDIDWKLKAERFHRYVDLPKYKSIDLSKLKTFADDIRDVMQKLNFVPGMLVNIMGKGGNDWPSDTYRICQELTVEITFY